VCNKIIIVIGTPQLSYTTLFFPLKGEIKCIYAARARGWLGEVDWAEGVGEGHGHEDVV
jgi:hypothetical protein